MPMVDLTTNEGFVRHSQTRPGRISRSLFAGIWLVYLIQPVASVVTGHHSAWYTDSALAVVAAFCVLYITLLATPERFVALARAQFAALFLLAVVGSAGYGGVQAWIFVSVVVCVVFRSPPAAARAVMASAACYLVTGLIAHVETTALFLNLIPVVLVGFAMIGFRRQAELMGELTRAREAVARLAANEERLRLARDLHDVTGQSLSMVTLKSELAARLVRRLPEGATGTGLRGMSERLSAVGGHLKLQPNPQDSRPGPRGFCLIASVPVRSSATVTV